MELLQEIDPIAGSIWMSPDELESHVVTWHSIYPTMAWYNGTEERKGALDDHNASLKRVQRQRNA